MKVKPVFRYQPTIKKFRILRFVWERGVVGDGKGFSAKLSFAVRPKIYEWWIGELDEWRLILLGVEIHFYKSYGGVFV
jgi:hypothetical protein